jgi:hypothetical protein
LTVTVPKVSPGWNWNPSSAPEGEALAGELDLVDAAEACVEVPDLDGEAGEAEGALVDAAGLLAAAGTVETAGFDEAAGEAAVAVGACLAESVPVGEVAIGVDATEAATGAVETEEEAGEGGATAVDEAGSEADVSDWAQIGPESRAKVIAILVFCTIGSRFEEIAIRI